MLVKIQTDEWLALVRLFPNRDEGRQNHWDMSLAGP